ncbi:MAG: hypothetical protein NTV21_07015 [Planctomycetota bacterium]|nr:hypothetical protein [Planctomycetota bacterium]
MKISMMAMACALLGGMASAQWSDDFNRPNGPLGPNWTVVTGTWAVTNNQGAHTSTPANEIAVHNTATGTYNQFNVTLDVFAQNLGNQFSGVLIGYGGTDTIQVKIQDQDTVAGFSNIGIYHRTSATGWGAWTGVGTGFSALTAPFSSARMTVSFPDSNTIKVELDTDFNGTPDQTYTKDSVLTIAPNLGTGYGLMGWGATALFDNWTVGGGATPPPVVYCTAGTTTNGCAASITASAQPSVTAANACNISVTNVEGQKSGLIFYSINGQLIQPWNATSFLCVKAPTQRTTTQSSGGTVGACDGTLALDWNAFQAANPTALGNPWAAGNKAQLQAWFRDPPAGKATNLSNGVELTYVP